MVMYMFFSLIATFITEGLIFMGIYLYETEIIAGEYKKVWGASGQGKMSFGTFTMSQSIALDAWVIAMPFIPYFSAHWQFSVMVE